jgi:hypothetical protein
VAIGPPINALFCYYSQRKSVAPGGVPGLQSR